MRDALTILQASTTKTATFNSAGVNLPGGTPTRGLFAQVLYSAANTSSGAGSLTFRITESADNSTFGGIFQTTESTVVLDTTAKSGEIFIPFNTSKPYVRLELSAISGTGATVTYEGAVVLGRP